MTLTVYWMFDYTQCVFVAGWLCLQKPPCHHLQTQTSIVCILLFTSAHLLCNFFPVFSFFSSFFCDLEQSAVQLFKELSNPALDLSRASWRNRIVVLTLMTAPPAVAEPPVGHQEECAAACWWWWWGAERLGQGEGGDWRKRQTDADWQRYSVSVWCS